MSGRTAGCAVDSRQLQCAHLPSPAPTARTAARLDPDQRHARLALAHAQGAPAVRVQPAHPARRVRLLCSGGGAGMWEANWRRTTGKPPRASVPSSAQHAQRAQRALYAHLHRRLLLAPLRFDYSIRVKPARAPFEATIGNEGGRTAQAAAARRSRRQPQNAAPQEPLERIPLARALPAQMKRPPSPQQVL